MVLFVLRAVERLRNVVVGLLATLFLHFFMMDSDVMLGSGWQERVNFFHQVAGLNHRRQKEQPHRAAKAKLSAL